MTDQPQTTRVRILLAIDCKGAWTSAGHSGDRSDPHEWIMIDDLDTHMVYHWIEAEVPVPGMTIIEGTLSKIGELTEHSGMTWPSGTAQTRHLTRASTPARRQR